MSRLFMLGLVVLLQGCATIVSGGGRQDLAFASTPSGATVSVNGVPKGSTPLTVSVGRSNAKGMKITISKEGYKPAEFSPTTSFDPWFMGNIIFGGLLGSTTDLASGSVTKYDQNAYAVTLEPEAGPPRKPDGVFLNQGDVGRVQQFILTSYAPLAADIARGNGTYLASLYELLGTPTSQQAETLPQLRALMTLYPDIAKFADAVAIRFGSSATLAPSPVN